MVPFFGVWDIVVENTLNVKSPTVICFSNRFTDDLISALFSILHVKSTFVCNELLCPLFTTSPTERD